MTKSEFQKMMCNNYIFLDGATGSNLQKAGMPVGVCPEKWIMDHSDIMIDLQKQYVQAGSNILYAPTFTANRIKLKEYGLYDSMEFMIQKLVSLSKKAAGKDAYVAGDLTMTGQQLEPMGDLSFDELVLIYKEQIQYLVKYGVDLLVVETMMSLQETRAAVIAAKEICDLPIMATLTFEHDGRTLYGTEAATAAIVLDKLGVDAIGANCSTGPAEMAKVLQSMSEVTNKPLIGKPNAGLPQIDENGNTYYDMDAQTFAQEMSFLTNAGATILGGCCGTTPEFIKKIATLPFQERKRKSITKRILTSERKSISFGLEDSFLLIGERINPTGKKKLQAALRDGDLDMVLDLAEEQEHAGASILDVNMGMSGIDEKERMCESIDQLSMATSLPLSIDSSHPDVMETALRRYPGRALINSVSFEKIKIDKILPLAKKYGAMFILLPVSDDGIPNNLMEKKNNIKKVIEMAYSIGLTKEDIIVDGLVATVGADENAAIDALETIRFCKEEGLATVCGLSNISFGLPERKFVNSMFLSMAIASGLTMAIANPNQDLLKYAAYATDMLLAKSGSSMKYIDYAMAQKNDSIAAMTETKKIETSSNLLETIEKEGNAEEVLYKDVLKGTKKSIALHTQDCLDSGMLPRMILDQILLPAINAVGEYFDKGTYFLPQLIASAEAMKTAIIKLEPLLKTDQQKMEMPIIVMATVAGDVHDIGKNLVTMMLQNYGFQVIDLGKDVATDLIVETAIEKNASVIGLSALMTTTMQEMRNVVSKAHERGYTGKIMIGGAVVTQEFATEIGADGYSADAASAVKLAEKLCDI